MKTEPPHYEDEDQERDHGFDWLTPDGPNGVDTVLAESEEYRELLAQEQGRTTHWFDGPDDALVRRGAPVVRGDLPNREQRRRRVKRRRQGRTRRLGEVRS